MLTNLINIIFAVTILQNGEPPQGRYLKNIVVTQGIYKDRIIVEWEKTGSATYTVMRSQNKTGGFVAVANTPDLKFEDLAVEKGVRYWYKVLPATEIEPGDAAFINDEEYQTFPEAEYVDPEADRTKSGKTVTENNVKDKSAEDKTGTEKTSPDNTEKNGSKKTTENKNDTAKITAEDTAADKIAVNVTDMKGAVNGSSAINRPCYSGFTSIETYNGVKLNDLMKQKKASLKTPSDAAAKKRQKKNLDYLQQYYMNPVKLTLYLAMSQPYFDRGELKVLDDCDTFQISEDMREVVFYNQQNNFMITFYSKIIRKVISRTDDPELVSLLLKNAELFCVPNGKKFVVDKNGVTRLVNSFEAVGLSTRYLKNDKEWKSRTIILSTSKPDLMEKLKNNSRGEIE